MSDSQFNLGFTQVVEYAQYNENDTLFQNARLQLNFKIEKAMGPYSYKLFKDADQTPVVTFTSDEANISAGILKENKYIVKQTELLGSQNYELSITFKSLLYNDYGTYRVSVTCIGDTPYLDQEIYSKSIIVKSPTPKVFVNLLDEIKTYNSSVTLNPYIVDKSISPVPINFNNNDPDILSTDSTETPIYKWFMNNEPLANPSSLATTYNATESNVYQVKVLYKGIVYESNYCKVNICKIEVDPAEILVCEKKGNRTNLNFNFAKDNFNNEINGSGNLRYEWVKSSNPDKILSNNRSLSLDNLIKEDSGDYMVRIYDLDIPLQEYEDPTPRATKTVTLKVLDFSVTLPVIDELVTASYVLTPSVRNLVTNSDVTSNLQYVWYKNNLPLNGQTSSTLNISTASNTDLYHVVVTYTDTECNASFTFESNKSKIVAGITLKSIPNKCYKINESLSLTAEFNMNGNTLLNGSGNLSYIWRYTSTSGSTTIVSSNRTYVVDKLTTENEGVYTLEVKDNETGQQVTQNIFVYVKNIEVTLSDVEVTDNNELIPNFRYDSLTNSLVYLINKYDLTNIILISFESGVNGYSESSYEWYRNGELIAYENNNKITVAEGGNYYVEVTYKFELPGDTIGCTYVVRSNVAKVILNSCQNLVQTLTYSDETNVGYFNNKLHRVFTVNVTGGSGNYKYTWLRALSGTNDYAPFPTDEAGYSVANKLRVPINLLTKYKFKANVVDLGN